MSPDWPLVRLGDHVDACLGKMLDAKKNKGLLQPYLGNSNVRWGRFDLADLAEMRFEPHEESRYGILPGDLIVCEGGEPGRCAVWTAPVTNMKIQKALHRIRPKNTLNNYYLYYWFLHAARVGLLESHFTGTTIKHLTGKAIDALEVPLPPISTQHAIVDTLRPLDARIELIDQENSTLEAIASAIFKAWFIDFDPVRAKSEGREPEGMSADIAALFPSEFVDSELGPIPKGWRVCALREMCGISSGKRPLLRSDIRTDEFGVPLYGGGGLMGFTSESNSSEPCILTGRVGTLGKVEIAFPPFWASDNVLVISPTEERRLSFCLHWVEGIDIRALNRGSTQPLLTQKDLGSQLGIIPPDFLIDVFDGIGSSILDKIRFQKLQAETLRELRDSLLPRLLSGAMTVPA